MGCCTEPVGCCTEPVGCCTEPVGCCTEPVGVGTGVTFVPLPVGVGVGVVLAGVSSTTPSCSIVGFCSLLLVIFTAALSIELTTEPSDPAKRVRLVLALASRLIGILAVILLPLALLVTSILAFLLPVILRFVFLAIVSFVFAFEPAFKLILADLPTNLSTLPLRVILFPLAASVNVPVDLSSMLLNTALFVILALGAFIIRVLLAVVSVAGIVNFTAFLEVNTIVDAGFSATAVISPFLVFTSTFFSLALTGTVPNTIVRTRRKAKSLKNKVFFFITCTPI